MGTYKNCYDILSDVRESLNEYSPSYVQGSDTSGTYQNRYLVRKINEAQRKIYNILIKRREVSEEFVEEIVLTAVDSVFTLPWNYGNMVYFKDEDGLQVHPMKQPQRKLSNSEGSALLYYRKGNTLVLDKPGITSSYTLIYYKKPRDLDIGVATAGAATSITMASTAKRLADYYVGMAIENVTKDWHDTVTAYTAGRVATIEETAAAGDFYGIVPDMPDMFHEQIATLAVLMIKAEYPVSQEKPTQAEFSLFNDSLDEAISAYTGQEDIPAEEYFMDDDFVPYAGGIIE